MGLNVLGLPKKAMSGLAATIRAVKAMRGVADGFVGTDYDGYATLEHLASGVPTSTKYLRGDGTWATGASLADGDYGDIEVSSTGGTLTVESYGGVMVLPAGTDLQPVIDGLSAGSHVLQLGSGTYYGSTASPTTPITIASTKGNVMIIGLGPDYTLIKSPILSETSRFGLIDVGVRPDGTTYGVKIFKSGSFTSRCFMHRVIIGASSAGAGDGPIDGLVLDGAGIFLAEQCTFSFCESDGVLVDSTAAEPNTTLKFDMCSFVQNAGYGMDVANACAIIEINGGNMEGNVAGEFRSTNMNSVYLHGVDFETSETMSNQVEINTCNPVRISSCNFLSIASAATRAIIVSGGSGIVIESNRFDGYTDTGAVRITEEATNATVYGNVILNDSWVEDYSR